MLGENIKYWLWLYKENEIINSGKPSLILGEDTLHADLEKCRT